MQSVTTAGFIKELMNKSIICMLAKSFASLVAACCEDSAL